VELTGKDRLLADYLLGRLPEEEQLRLEAAYLADPEAQEELVALEAELIDAYVRGELGPVERQGLEAGLLASPRGRARLDFARSWAHRGERTPRPAGASVDRSRPPFWRRLPLLAGTRLAAAAAGLTLALGLTALSWRYAWEPRPPDVAPEGRSEEPGGPAPGAGAGSPPPSPDASTGGGGGPAQGGRPPRREHWNELYAGNVRGGGEPAEVRIPRGSPAALLKLNLDVDNHPSYAVALTGTGWVEKGLRSRRTRTGSALFVRVPAALLEAGAEYTLVLSPGREPARPIRAYAFTVRE